MINNRELIKGVITFYKARLLKLPCSVRGSVGRCFFCFSMMFCRPEKMCRSHLMRLHISQKLPFTFHNFNFHHAVPSLRGECPRIFPSLVETGSAAQLPVCRHRLGYRNAVWWCHFIAQHKSLFFIAYAYRNRRLALLPYALAVITRSNFFGSDACTRFLLHRPAARWTSGPTLWTGNPTKLFHLFWRTGDVEMKLSAL